MTQDEHTALLSLMDSLTENLQDFSALTGDLMKENTTDAELMQLVERRGALVERMKEAESELYGLVYAQPLKEQGVYHKLLSGRMVLRPLGEQEKAVRQKALHLSSLKKEITQKDAAVTERFGALLQDAKQALEESRKDRQKLDLYHSVSNNSKGSRLDQSL